MDKTEQKKRSEELSRLLPSVRFLRFEDVPAEYAQFRDSQNDIFDHDQEINELIPPDLHGMSAVRSLSGKKLMNQYAGQNAPYYDSGSVPPPSPVSAPVLAPYATPGPYEELDSYAAGKPYAAPAAPAPVAPVPAVSAAPDTVRIPYDTSDSYAAPEPGVTQVPFVFPATYEQPGQYSLQAVAPVEEHFAPFVSDNNSYSPEPPFGSGYQGSNESMSTSQNHEHQDYLQVPVGGFVPESDYGCSADPDIPSDDLSVLPEQKEVLFPEPFPDMNQPWINVPASFTAQDKFNYQEDIASSDIMSSQQTEDIGSCEQASRNMDGSADTYGAVEPDSVNTDTAIEPAAVDIKPHVRATVPVLELSTDAEAAFVAADVGESATEDSEDNDAGAGAADYPPWEEPPVKVTSRKKKKSTKVQADQKEQKAIKPQVAVESSVAAPGTDTVVEPSVLVDTAAEVKRVAPVTAPAADDDSEEGGGAVDYPPWEEPPVKVTSRKKKKSNQAKTVHKEQDVTAVPAAAESSGKETAVISPVSVSDQADTPAAADVPVAADASFAAKTADAVTADMEFSAVVLNQVKPALEAEEELEAAAGNAEFEEDELDEVCDDMDLADIVALIDRYQKETGESAFSKVYLE